MYVHVHGARFPDDLTYSSILFPSQRVGDVTFHYLIEALYKEPFGYIEGRGIKEQENYSPLFP